ncbi:MAG TPA: hypothetical protein DC064_24160 [Cyanobacteria bacterium UBA9273]|nr:hypothetical protein [Cyanobacteria bacterium UBA9273]
MSNIGQSFIRFLNHSSGSLIMASLGILAVSSFAEKALADPPPQPPPQVKLPPVFCFRFTDIKADKDDAEMDKFQFQFEVLNWSNKPAGGVRISLNQGTGATGSVQAAPFFAGASIDLNGQPIGANSNGNPIPGNQELSNYGSVESSSQTTIQWQASTGLNPLNPFETSPIPNSNLLGAKTTPEACGLVPGCTVVGGFPDDRYGNPTVPNMETVDDGKNVLDGFVFTVDDFDEGEFISFNWNLLDDQGNPIGTPGQGNDYGFGTINIFRNDLEESINPGSLFVGNTGLGTSPLLFYNNVNRVPDWNGHDGLHAMFQAEFGAGITAPFLKREDNVFNSATNTQLVANLPRTVNPSDSNPQPESVPEPSNLAMVGLTIVSLLTYRQRRRHHRLESINR